MALSKEQWADREVNTLAAFLDDLDNMDGYPQNKLLASEVVSKLIKLFNL